MSGGWRNDLEDWKGVSELPDDQPLLALMGSYNEQKLDPRQVLKCENQGSQGSCRGHSGSTLAEWIHAIATGTIGMQLSRAMMYYETQRIDGIRGDRGATIMGGIKLLRETGVCREELWKYPPQYNNARPSNFSEVLQDAATHKVVTSRRCSSYDAVRVHLGSGQGGVDVGIQWRQEYASPIVERFSGGGGGHAIAVVCLSERLDNQGRPYVWMFNSHGMRSGVNGWSEWSPTFVESAIRSPGSVFVAVSDMPNVKPREFTFEEALKKAHWWRK